MAQRRLATITYPPDYLRCRVLRHAWEAAGSAESAAGQLLVNRCTSCGTLRYDSYDLATGARLRHPDYAYPEGYQDKGEGHDADWYRKSWIEHLYRIGVIDTALPDTRKRVG
jgi:hypothetical protein